MNTSAFYTNREIFEAHFREAHALSNFDPITDDAILDYAAEFYFSEWYDLCITAGIPTAKSNCAFCIADLSDCPAAIDAAIATMPDGHCFARLDTCSSKPTAPFCTAKDIAAHLMSSTRTQFVASEDPHHRLILREWIDELDFRFWEIRVFVVGGVIRAISGPHGGDFVPHTLKRYLTDIIAIITKIIVVTEYPDCTIDLLLPRGCADNIQLIEINTPVWLFATSGVFDITLPADVAILCGPIENLTDVITLPVWRCETAQV